MNQESPALMNELRALRQRKGELEGHLGALQDSRYVILNSMKNIVSYNILFMQTTINGSTGRPNAHAKESSNIKS